MLPARPTLASLASASLALAAFAPAAASTEHEVREDDTGDAGPRQIAKLKGVEAVTADHGRFIAVGAGGDGGRNSRAKAWRSQDGRSWEQTDAPDEKGLSMRAVTGMDRGYVALGTQAAPQGSDEGDRLAAWTSDLGYSWSPATMEPAGAEFHGVVHLALTDGPAGPLALADDTAQFRLWRSGDGRTWRLSNPPPVDRAIAITATPNRYLLSGFDADEDLSVEDSLRLFASADGETWEELGDAPPVSGIAAAPNGVIVGTGLPELWATADLESWQQVWEPELPTEAEGPARWLDAQGYGDSVTWTGDRFATTGFIYTPGCLDDPSRCPGPANLSSPDGFTWAEMTGPDGKQGSEGKAWTARSVASLLGHTVVVGQQGRRLEVWLYETPAAVADHAAGTLGQRSLQ